MSVDLEQYAEHLYSKIGEAVYLVRATIEGGDWQPKPNMCNHNATIWCDLNPEYKPVRGWLYFDLPGLNFVKFVAHSVIESPSGELIDITPSNAMNEYPFIDGGLSDEEYESLVKATGNGELNVLKKMHNHPLEVDDGS